MYNKKSCMGTLLPKINPKNLLKFSRTFLITVFLLTAVSQMSVAQDAKITVNLQNKPLNDLLDAIKAQTKYSFWLDMGEVNVNRTITVNAQEQTVKSVLMNVLPTQGLEYSLTDNHIVIFPKKTTATLTETASDKRTVTGVILDETDSPIIGASVMVKGTSTGALTDLDGKFTIAISPGETLQVSYIGYETQEVNPGNNTNISIQLKENINLLNEVVVVGYGTRSKVTLTGAVAAVKGNELVKSPATNIVTSLAGRLPGVIISSRNGDPGGENVKIMIRGSGTTGNRDPLIIIDGVERGGLGQLNPNDIENISVLKDAEGAIYGAKAANGVILITTKRGTLGKPIVSLSYNQGFSQPVRNPKLADAYTFATVANEIKVNEHTDPNTNPVLAYTPEEIEKYRNGTDPNYPNTDWYDYIVRNLTPVSRANLSVSGGTERVNYYLSLGYLGQEGQYKKGAHEYKQYNFRSNIDIQVTDNFKIGFDLGGRYDDKYTPITSNSEINSHIYLYHPTWQAYWPGTNYMQPLRGGENILNWVSDNAGYVDHTTKAFQGTVHFEWELPWVKGLKLYGSGSHDAGYNFNKNFRQPAYIYNKNGDTYEKARSGMTSDKASLEDNSTFSNRTYLMGRISYDRSFGLHNVNALAGYEQTEDRSNYLMAYRSDFTSASLPQINQGSVEKSKQNNDGWAKQYAAQNYFGRINYDYSGKYMAQFTLRVDGSTNFPKDNRFGYFPSFSAGWRMSEEPFMKSLDFLDNLKIRASYGVSGNDRVDPYQYMTTYGYGSNYVIGGTDVQGLDQGVFPNPNITWETSKTWNFGLESTFWGGMLGVELDVFRSMRSDILHPRNVAVPNYTGVQPPHENFGKVRNQGFELVLSHTNHRNPIKYSISANLNYHKNKIIDIDEAPAAEPYQLQTGGPIGTGLYYKAIGIYKTQEEIDKTPHLAGTQPGDIRYADLNDDDIIDSRDRIRVESNAIPRITYGLNAHLEYRNFDLSILFQGQEKVKTFVGDGFFGTLDPVSFGNFLTWRSDGRWIPGADNTNATMPRARTGYSNNNTMASTHWLLDAGFLRLKNLEIGYNVPKTVCEKIGIAGLRISASGSNLWLIYDHMGKLGFDPETDAYWYYPQQRTFNFGVNLTF